jgi:hypothetical protein
MAKPVSMIGIDPSELRWLRMLVLLLRHPDPTMSELVRQALIYLNEGAEPTGGPQTEPLHHAD